MIARICWAVLALVHLMPAVATFRPSLIARLYGVAPGTQTFLLLHHRAALFLVVLTICVWAAFRPEVRPLGLVALTISMASFLALYLAGGAPASLRTIAVVDLIGLPFLALAAWQVVRS